MGLGIGATGIVGLAPMFRTPSSSPTSSNEVIVEAGTASAACVSPTRGAGWSFPDVPLVSSALGCVPAPPAPPALAGAQRPTQPLRAAARAVTDRAPKKVARPPVALASTKPTTPKASAQTPPKPSVSPGTTLPAPPIVDTPCQVKKQDDPRDAQRADVAVQDEQDGNQPRVKCTKP
jgi:hypothetical protein